MVTHYSYVRKTSRLHAKNYRKRKYIQNFAHGHNQQDKTPVQEFLYHSVLHSIVLTSV